MLDASGPRLRSALSRGSACVLSYSRIVGQDPAQLKLLFAAADRSLLFHFAANRPRRVFCRQGQNAEA